MSNVPPITQNFARPSYRADTPAGLDPDMRRMGLIAAGLVGFVALAAGGFSLTRHRHHAIPVIEPAAGPVRIKPLDPGGMKVAGAEESASGVEALAPPAEKPAIRALRAKTHAQPATPHPAPPADTRMAPAAAPVTVAQKAPAAEAVPDAARLGHRTAVQLAAFDTQEAAEQEWGRLALKMPGLLNAHHPEVERAQLAGRTMYQLRTGGFADMAEATAFCGKVRAKGGDCTIAAL